MQRDQTIHLPRITMRCGLAIVAAGVFLSAGCSSYEPQPASDDKLVVLASLPPLAYLIDRVGGDHVRVEQLLRPGDDPHTFQPSAREVMRFSSADLFFHLGMPLESRLADRLRSGRPDLIAIDLSQSIDKLSCSATGACCPSGDEHEDDSSEEPEEDGHQHAQDPHVWMSTKNLTTLAHQITELLCHIDPSQGDDYKENGRQLVAEIESVHEEIAGQLESHRGRTFYAYHPSLGYFADEYSLVQKSVEVEGKAPTPKQLISLVEEARTGGATVVFVQPQFNKSTATRVAEAIGASLVEVDPLAYDVLAAQRNVAAQLVAGFARSP